MVAQLIIEPWRNRSVPVGAESSGVRAAVVLPDDEEIALCRIALACQSRGTTTLTLSALSAGVRALLSGLTVLGVESHFEASSKCLTVRGLGLETLAQPDAAIDARGHSQVAALLVGICVSRPFLVELWVDPVVAQCLIPILGEKHQIELDELGRADAGEGCRVRLLPTANEARPEGVSLRDDGVFAWVKQAVLLAGLRAKTMTVFEEAVASSDHLERALLRARVPLQGEGTCIILHPPRDADAMAPQRYDAIGSPEMGLALMAAVTSAPHGQLVLRDVSLNPTRTLMIPLLRGVGYGATTIAEGDRQGEPIGRMVLQWGSADQPSAVGRGRGLNISGQTAMRLGDGALWMLAMASTSSEAWEFSDFIPQGRGSDPRVWGRALGLLRSAGVQCEDRRDGTFGIGGGAALRALRWTSGGDVRLLLLATALALRAAETTVIDDVDCLRDAFPKWVGTLKALGAKVEVRHE